jgi:hypothetical protein
MKIVSFPTTNLRSMAQGLIADYGIPNSQYETGIKDFVSCINANERYVLAKNGGLENVSIIEVEDM